MSNNIVQLTDYNDNNIYPIAGAAAEGSITKTMLDEGVFVGAELSDPGNIAYVGTADIQDSAVTTAKIADLNVTTAKLATGAVTSDKIDSATLTPSDVTFASGYGVVSGTTVLAIKSAGRVSFVTNFFVPAITSTDNQTVAFTLPPGWKPRDISNFATPVGAGNICRVRVSNDGSVKVSKIMSDIDSSNFVSTAVISYIANS